MTTQTKQTAVTIVETDSEDALYCRYSGQSNPQPCLISLDCESGHVSAGYDSTIGSGCSFREWHGHVQTWRIPLLTGTSADTLMRSLLPLAERVVVGYSAVWDGNNTVAQFTADARAAVDAIRDACDSAPDEREQFWTAESWMAGTERDSISATTTDAEIVTIAQQCEDACDGIITDDLAEYLREYRDGLRVGRE